MNPANFLYRSGSRLAGAYWTDSAGLLTQALDEDMGPCIVFLSIMAANLGDPKSLASSSMRWDEVLRHPVSVYRLARDLGLPYETVRRYAARLNEKSLGEKSSQGLLISPSAMERPPLVDLLKQMADMSARLHADMKAIGAPISTPGSLSGDVHERRVAAMSVFYFLRGVAIATETLSVDPVPAMVHFSIHRANLAYLEHQPELRILDDAHVHLDEVRRPVSVFAIARRLNLPYETARRHVNALARRGLVQKAADEGFIVPSDLLKTKAFIDCVRSTMDSTVDFLETAFSPRMH